MGLRKVFRRLEQKENLVDILTPINILEQKKTIEEVNANRVGKRFVGSFLFLDISSLPEKFVNAYMEFGGVNEKGQISGEWKIGLIGSGKKEFDPEGVIKINSDFSSSLCLRKDADEKEMFLVLSLNK